MKDQYSAYHIIDPLKQPQFNQSKKPPKGIKVHQGNSNMEMVNPASSQISEQQPGTMVNKENLNVLSAASDVKEIRETSGEPKRDGAQDPLTDN